MCDPFAIFPRHMLRAGLSRRELLVLLCLLSYRNGDGHAWPSRPKISADTGLRISHVHESVRSLAGRGIIRCETQAGVRTVYSFPCLDHPEHPLDMVSPAPAPVVAKNATAADAVPAPKPVPMPAPEPAPAPEHPTGDNPSPVAAPEPAPAQPSPRREIVSASVDSLPDVDDAVRREVDARPIIRTSSAAQPDDDLMARARRLAAKQADNAARHEMARLVAKTEEQAVKTEQQPAKTEEQPAKHEEQAEQPAPETPAAPVPVVVKKSPEPAPQQALPIICEPQTPAATPQHGELLPAETKSERTKRATRLPDDWQLPRAWGVWAMQEMGMTEDAVRWEADKFADYWHARSGQGATKMNWHATWRNWIRRNAESGGTASGAPQHKSKMTQALDNLANMKLDWEHQETWNPFAPPTPEERAAAQKREDARAAARIAEAAKIINFR